LSAGAEVLPFALPDVGEREIEAVSEAIRSGWLSSGPRVKQFEAEFAATLGDDIEAVAVSSATAGLHLALEALGIQQGDEVLVPTWTFTSTAEVVRYLGAEPVLVDVHSDTLNIDLGDAANKLTDRTRAIMPVHFAGHPISPKSLEAFSLEHGIGVVEDAAHAFPASVEGSLVGAGDSAATVFSFYATKTLTTGEGGMLVTRDAAVAERARVMRLHGISRDAFDRYRSTVPAWQYDVVAPGYKYNLTDPAAAMGLVQLARSVEMRSSRLDIAARYDEAFAALPLDLPTASTPGIEHAWHLYVVRMPVGGVPRDTFIEELARLGVACSVHFIPLHKQPYWRQRCGHKDNDFPVATAEFDRVVSLPIFSRMTAPDVERVVVAVESVLAS
jgi:dTDP-4-amino-4,6-dideoxygalactose transaminase